MARLSRKQSLLTMSMINTQQYEVARTPTGVWAKPKGVQEP